MSGHVGVRGKRSNISAGCFSCLCAQTVEVGKVKHALPHLMLLIVQSHLLSQQSSDHSQPKAAVLLVTALVVTCPDLRSAREVVPNPPDPFTRAL